MSPIEEIYNIIETFTKFKSGIKRKDIVRKFIRLRIFGTYESITIFSCYATIMTDIKNFLLDIDYYITENFLYTENGLIFITLNHKSYINYTKTLSLIFKIIQNDDLIDNSIDDPIDDPIDESVDDLINNSVYDNEKPQDIVQKKIFSNVKSHIEKSSQEIVTNEKFFYIINSLTNKDNFYLVNKSTTKCTCKAFFFCKNDIKTCKHIKDFPLQSLEKLDFIHLTNDGYKCICGKDSPNKRCKHILYMS